MADRVAVVTGASRGLGRALSIHLSRQGMAIVGVARDSSDLDATLSLLEGDGHRMVSADLGAGDGIDAVVAAAGSVAASGGLSALIHCASSTPDPDAEASLGETSAATLDEHAAVAGLSGVKLLASLKPHLSAADSSSAILISSDWALEGSHGPPGFAASKAYVTHAWRSAQAEYLADGIVLSTIVAGDIATYDEDWEEPIWSLDDPVSAVREELGNTRIAISDVVRAVDLVLSAELAAVTEIRLRPLDPDYTW